MLLALVKPFLNTLREHGVKIATERLVSYVYDYFFDLHYGTDTFAWAMLDQLEVDIDKLSDSTHYQPTHVYPLQKLMKKLNISTDSIFVDFGCGKGRSLLLAAQFGVREARGIDISPILCETAIKNCNIYARKNKSVKTKFSVFLQDVRHYNFIDDESVIFLFNPFGYQTLKDLMRMIELSLQRNPRRIMMIYGNPIHSSLITGSNLFFPKEEFYSLGQDFAIFENIITNVKE